MSSSLNDRSNTVGISWALTAAGLWGTFGLVGRSLFRYGAGPLSIIALRAALAAGVLGLILLVVQPAALRITRRDLLFFSLFGPICVAGNYLTFFIALEQVGAILSTTLLYTYPAIAAVLAMFFLGERLDLRRIVPLPVTLLGCALVVGLFGPSNVVLQPGGIAWALVSAVTAALYSLLSRQALKRYSPWTLLFYSIASGSLFLGLLWAGLCTLLPTPGALCGTIPSLAPSNLAFWGGVLFLALGPTLGSYGAYLQSLRFLEVRQASLLATTEVIINAVLAYLFLGERLTTAQWIGGALILGTVLWVRLERPALPSPTPASTVSEPGDSSRLCK